jgi:hypothetical protein
MVSRSLSTRFSKNSSSTTAPAPAPASAEMASSAPTRSATAATTATAATSPVDAVPEFDPNSTPGLLADRLSAWKSVVGNLEDYTKTIEKIHKAQAKEYEAALKSLSAPLKHAENFDQSLGGIAGFFENMRANTQALINTNAETEKSIKGQVLPVLERLHKEIKNKGKELAHGADKGAKLVAKARNATQKHIETLGQQTAAFESTGGKMHSADDPYVVHRGVLHTLHRQVVEENNHHNDLVAVQANFETFEAHVITVIQQAFEAFTQLAAGQGEKTRALHTDMLATVQKVPHDLEWKGFVQRSGDRLVDANAAPRSVEAIAFPNMEHASTRPLVEGSLERKSRNKLSWGYSTAYYVVTPAKFLHEFKDSDNARHEPKPELSIYLPDAVIGALSGDKFNVKGRDVSKGLTGKLSGSSELAFKAHTPADAARWCEVIKECIGGAAAAVPVSPIVSPTGTWNVSEGGASPVSPATPAADTKEAFAPAAAAAPAAAPAAAAPATTDLPVLSEKPKPEA